MDLLEFDTLSEKDFQSQFSAVNCTDEIYFRQHTNHTMPNMAVNNYLDVDNLFDVSDSEYVHQLYQNMSSSTPTAGTRQVSSPGQPHSYIGPMLEGIMDAVRELQAQLARHSTVIRSLSRHPTSLPLAGSSRPKLGQVTHHDGYTPSTVVSGEKKYNNLPTFQGKDTISWGELVEHPLGEEGVDCNSELVSVLGGDWTPKQVQIVDNVMNTYDAASMTRGTTAGRQLLLDSIPEHGGDNNDQNPARNIQSDTKTCDCKTWSTDLSTVNTNTTLPAVRKYKLYHDDNMQEGVKLPFTHYNAKLSPILEAPMVSDTAKPVPEVDCEKVNHKREDVFVARFETLLKDQLNVFNDKLLEVSDMVEQKLAVVTPSPLSTQCDSTAYYIDSDTTTSGEVNDTQQMRLKFYSGISGPH